MTQHRASHGKAIIAVLALSAMVSSLQFTLTVPILSEIPHLLQVSPADATWLITATLLSSTVSTPVVSRMADLYGRKRLLLIALTFLCAGSIIAAVGMTFPTVIIGRVLQGFSMSIVPIGVSLIHSHVSPAQANMGVALMSGTIGVGSSLGLPLSGFLVEHTGLAGIFWATAAVSSVFLLLVYAVVPEAPDRLPKRIDLFSTVMLTLWLTALTLTLSKGGEWGWASLPTFISALGSLTACVVWVFTSLRTSNAVIDIRFALSPEILRINIASFCTTLGMFANHLVTMQEARAPLTSAIGLGLPVAQAGLLLVPFALIMIALTPVTGWAIQRFGGSVTLRFGAGVMAGGFIFRSAVHGTLSTVLIGTLIVGVGTSFAFASMPALISASAPASELASANGLNSLVRSLSGALASSLFALVLVTYPLGGNPEMLSETGLRVIFVSIALTCTVAAFLMHRHSTHR